MSDNGVFSESRRDSLGARDVHLWLCSRSLMPSSDDFKRRILSRYAAVLPADWQFVRNTNGKPTLAGAATALNFNLSHSGDWQACAVTAGTPVGVDIEFCRAKRETMKLARRFFREEEVAALQDCSATQQRDRFYDLWTLKEAAVKARGEALAPGLQSRGFELTFEASSQAMSASIAVTTADAADTAHYYLLDPLTGYRVAICWLSASRVSPRLQIFALRAGDEQIDIRVPLRASTRGDCSAARPAAVKSC